MIMHLHFSELNHNAGTLSHVMEDNSTCVTTKLRQNLTSEQIEESRFKNNAPRTCLNNTHPHHPHLEYYEHSEKISK